MSNDNLSSGQPDRGKRETKPPAGVPKKKQKPLPLVRMDSELEENDVGRVAHSPALRLTAWLVAIVVLLTILGWALGGNL